MRKGGDMKKLLAAGALGAAALVAQAQPNEAARAEYEAAARAANAAALPGPADVKLADQAMLKLPRGLTYIPAAESGRLLAAMGNRVGDGLLGIVLSPTSQSGWFVVMRFLKSGYIRDDDAKEWDVEELLAGLRAGTEEGNEERRARGITEIEIVGWVEAPKYDAGTHRLAWSLESREKGAAAGGERGVNYNTYALGREGYISMNLVTGMNEIQAEKPIAQELLAALQYHEGKRYGDFNSATDRVAEYGLAALVGGFAAQKLGVFALLMKFWKLIAVALIAAGALFLALRKKASEQVSSNAHS
jgi:uncharacterized membrane-anchored protein